MVITRILPIIVVSLSMLECGVLRKGINNCCTRRFKKSWLRNVDTVLIYMDSLCEGYYFSYRPLSREGVFKEARFVPVLRFLFFTLCENDKECNSYSDSSVMVEAFAFVGRENGRKMILFMYVIARQNIIICEKFVISKTAAYSHWTFCNYDTIPYVNVFTKGNKLFGRYRSISYEYFLKMWHMFRSEKNN